jgi:undecaprenyl-diphosphatase
VDWRLYKAVYDVSLHHHWVGSLFHGVEAVSIPFMIVVTCALWLLAPPGGSRKWKLAAGSALVSAGVAIAVNRIISTAWFRQRPFVAHHIAHPWINSTDASFPSDHASASFAIAFAVLLFEPVAGVVFLVFAVVIAVGRLFIGAHYPGDVAAGLAVGALSALVVVRLGRPVVAYAVKIVERFTDPVLRPLWRRV